MISYHASDPFECPDGFPRMYYYFGDTIWLPTAVFDGKDPQIGGGQQVFSIYETRYHEHMQINTPGVLAVAVEYDSSTRDGAIVATFTSVDQISQADLHFRYAISESHIYHEWLELDSLQFVVRDMLPDHMGVPFSINQGAAVVDTQSFHIDAEWVDRNCELVAFVQSDQDTTVLISRSLPLYRNHVSGDANGDGVVTISDAGFLSNYLLFGAPEPEPLASGDPNEDCQIDIQDIVYLLDYLFHQGPVPLRGCEID
ncbi:MAG: dockerin type I domain-containing protein [Candidatus Zixiibacteriota bacterium]